MQLADMLDMEVDYPYEMTVHAGEFLDFIGQHDADYLSLFTTLWDTPAEYDNPKMNGKPVKLIKPTVNMLGASTPKNMSLAFPSSAMDTGNLSRMIFVYADPVPKSQRILNPEIPSEEATQVILKRLEDISKLKGAMSVTKMANEVMEYIYKTADDHPDPRLQYYSGRRGTHLWKLAMVCAATRNDLEITDWDVLQANSILAVAEHTMSRALGNFGRSKQSAVTHDLVEWVRNQGVAVKIPEVYRQFNRDFSSESEFQAVMQDLQAARRLVPLEANGVNIGLTTRDVPFPEWQVDILCKQALLPSELDIIGMPHDTEH